MLDNSDVPSSHFAAPSALPRRTSPFTSWVQVIRAHSFLWANAILFAANISSGLFSYLFHPVVGRLLGPVDYGRATSLMALSSILLIPAPIVGVVVSKYASSLAAEHKLAELHGLLRRLTLLLVIAGVLVAGLLVVFSVPIASFLKLPTAAATGLLGLVLLVSLVNTLNQGSLQGLQCFGWLAGLQITGQALRVAGAALLVLLGLGVNGVVLALSISVMIPYALSFKPLRRALGSRWVPVQSLRPLMAYSVVATLASAAVIVLTNADTILAKHFLSDHDAGLYAALAVMGKIVLFVNGSITTYMFPQVSALHARGERYGKVLLQSLLAVLLLSCSVLAVFLIFPVLAVHTMFGASYLSVAPLLAWYGLAMLFLALASVLLSYYMAIGRRSFLYVLIACSVLQIGLIAIWHGSPDAIVQVVVAVMFMLLVGMSVPLLPRFGGSGLVA